MLTIGCYITIRLDTNKSIQFNYVNNIEVKTATNDLTDTAVVKVSKKMHSRSQRDKLLIDSIAVGNGITIEAGYKETGRNTLFKGYITKIDSLSTPLTIYCENEMTTLKRIMVRPKVYKNFNIAGFVQEYMPKMWVISPDDIKFGEVVVEREMTMAAFFGEMKKKFAYFKPFFLDGMLYVITNSYHKADSTPITLDPKKNIISHDLKLTRAEDVKESVTATTILPNNTKLEVKVPEGENGSTDNKSIYLPGISDLKTLREAAENYLKIKKSDRMTGTVTTFGVPFVRKCDLVLIKDAEHPEITNRKFVVEAVTYTVGSGGYRQRIKLGDEIKQKQNL